MARDDDFVLTLSDNEDGFPDEIEEEEAAPAQKLSNKKRKRDSDVADAGKGKNKKNKKQKNKGAADSDDEDEDNKADDDGAIDPDFEFQLGDGVTGNLQDFDGWTGDDATKGGNKKAVDIDDIIARRMQNKKEEQGVDAAAASDDEDAADFTGFDDMSEIGEDELLAEDGFGMGAEAGEDEEVDSDDEDGSDAGKGSGNDDDDDEAESGASDEEGEDDEIAAHVAHPDDISDAEDEDNEAADALEAEKAAAFFAPEENMDGQKGPSSKPVGSFQEMSLSRPILKGLSAVGFTAPTPIQHKAIPVALLGKDLVGGAVTGSGKTGAFIIPILERLLYRPKKVATTRVAILMPTRELALQCYNVATKLASFTDITFGQAIGGLNSREQEAALKLRPDIVIATPGRFIDFMRNSSAFQVDTIEILVLDEADRMLEDGFADELNEILTTIPKSRQTMLFSATMTNSVDSLIRVGLNRPVRLLVDAKRQTVSGLTQEFVRLRPGREDKRLGYLLHLCKEVYTTRTIIFFRQKKEAHRVRIIFALLGLKAAELHGSMSQDQRINAIEAFRSGSANYLLATDLASRGLDIKNVEVVINYEAPQSHEIYLHRVGRTARAGRSGRSCTIAAEPDRKVVKAAVKTSREQGAVIKSRIINPADADSWCSKVDNLEEEIEAVMREEKEEKVLATAEMQMKRTENIMSHEKEIMARTKKTWFESEKDRKAAKEKGRNELNGVIGKDGNAVKGPKKKLSNKEKKKLEDKDERREGGGWKKGAAERSGKGVLEKGTTSHTT
ncbi:P-loop containing nucleoside triphosphate hydrolase protein [Delphinella strobiligena]|nr:P-loop containing nucleoside triphosphate hydrolase protein [Delphinella strobiligena]